MAQLQITFTMTEFCLHTGVTEAELIEIVGLGVIQPSDPQDDNWLFDDGALLAFHRAQRLQRELALDWPGVAVTLTLLDEIEQLRKENNQLRHRLERFIAE
ncbi:chaperone modulator CbpM [Serratia sp. UGAL515B_01]|uniref:chaperone modulator CbpM n=1 Tax=Serratia sp. UGAL515B_01 TaxID=2986763 RepID=UPI002955D302|nr:chaperone modulator CbpM [Serratia sp. UGAL515B_01]WON78900.1 chaperone modulator CbpM [Serratia sp. UGAL515B_01]